MTRTNWQPDQGQSSCFRCPRDRSSHGAVATTGFLHIFCRFPRLLTPAMAHPSRRVPSPNPSRYYAVPQSPQHPNHPYAQQHVQHQPQQRRPSRSNRTQPAPVNERPAVAPMPPRNDLAQGVATGAIGAGYGPYSVRPSSSVQI